MLLLRSSDLLPETSLLVIDDNDASLELNSRDTRKPETAGAGKGHKSVPIVENRRYACGPSFRAMASALYEPGGR